MRTIEPLKIMSKLTIVAHIHAEPEKVDLVKSELLKLIEPTRAEKGCLNYDLHQDDETPTHFLFFENWESRELWQAHMKNQHIADFMEATEGAVENVILNEMTQIG
ncbi:antibiotic biosynthesis monooxygenase [Akkermansiaceae bacterium]|nr:antibiotic biosynthesis monooxygenase [Akkermansiaceae bacterium]MDB4296889.1 antibiotic biosynthesis monooxygenase [Akkermansiaceae bacterium]MDB4305222.1 antibiotic biosynthesis monooxygenase [Akkermansiaceae bacterium]MDB4309504.1 antibiotic biosynthesis monooxygenase [Akkermansiaceae bacterium]MDB4320973.1 antibiotic biosynthesis monooxygenase [Akkermansiaceae bacterium]